MARAPAARRGRGTRRWPGRRSGRRRSAASGCEALAGQAGELGDHGAVATVAVGQRLQGGGVGRRLVEHHRRRRVARDGGRGRRCGRPPPCGRPGRPSVAMASAAAAWYEVIPGSTATVRPGRGRGDQLGQVGEDRPLGGSPNTATATSSPASRPATAASRDVVERAAACRRRRRRWRTAPAGCVAVGATDRTHHLGPTDRADIGRDDEHPVGGDQRGPGPGGDEAGITGPDADADQRGPGVEHGRLGGRGRRSAVRHGDEPLDRLADEVGLGSPGPGGELGRGVLQLVGQVDRRLVHGSEPSPGRADVGQSRTARRTSAMSGRAARWMWR